MKRVCGWVAQILMVGVLLAGCQPTDPLPGGTTTATAPEQTTGTTAATTVLAVTAEGEWTVEWPVLPLLSLAESAPQTLAFLGEEKVTLLADLAPFLSDLETEATLRATVSLDGAGGGRLTVTREALAETAAQVLADYNPLLKNVLLPLVTDQLPADTEATLWYETAGEVLTAGVADNRDSALCARFSGSDIVVTDSVSRTLTPAAQEQMLAFWRDSTITRKNPLKNR